jgi:molybdate transport system substrate-binding protein
MKSLLAALGLCLCASQAAAQDSLLVFAAASLKNALDEVNSLSSTRVLASYAASSALARQIESGAPAQVFLSADLEWMDYVEKKGLLKSATRRNLLGNRLVWIVPSAGPLPADPVGALGSSGRLALGDPQHVPAGKYAKAALERLGLWQQLSGRVAAAENVRAALALVARGEAPLGIVYETDAQAEPRVRIAAKIDAGTHPPIVYPVALLRDAKPAASDYLALLASAKAQVIFRKHGFTPL